MDPESAQAHLLVADISDDLGDRRTARREYHEVLRIDPENAVARHDLAVLDANSHRPARALGGLVDAGRMDPAMPQVLTTVSAVLWQLSWRLRIWLIAATLVVIVSSDPDPDTSSWTASSIAAGILLASAALVCWTTRDLPRRTRPVVLAALRTDRPLWFTYLTIAACLLVYALVAVTGRGALSALVWLILAVLGLLALVVRVARRHR